MEQNSTGGPGIVSFISASSYLGGDAFCGMREHMRRLCDEIWILDLGGEGRGTRRSENVIAIQTPVAVAVAARYGQPNKSKPARVRYARLEGTREEKLMALDAISSFDPIVWEDCPDGWLAPFEPAGVGDYFGWPLLTDLMPWQHSGAQFKRTWPICTDRDTLKARWRALLRAKDRVAAFKETRDRKINGSCPSLQANREAEKSISELKEDASPPPIERYAYRSFDRRWILADGRLGDFLRPVLWAAHSDRQVYLTSLFSQPLGAGPALSACAQLPDLDHFRGSYGAKAVLPLYRDAGCAEANVHLGLLDLLYKA